MNDRSAKLTARLDELLLEQAISGLDENCSSELEGLQAASGTKQNPYMKTAALVQLGLASMDQTNSSMPDQLRRKLLANASGVTRSGGYKYE